MPTVIQNLLTQNNLNQDTKERINFSAVMNIVLQIIQYAHTNKFKLRCVKELSFMRVNVIPQYPSN